jgi:hypothetical protein
MMHFSKTAFISVCFLAAPVSIWAQTARASISGTVYDSSGAVVPAATLTATDTERNISDTRKANGAGRYLFSDLTPGNYTLEAGAAGFKKYRTTNIVLEVGQRLELSPTLQVGATNEEVTVSANAVGLETATATVSGVVDSKQVSDLPLNARDFYSLLQLVPNVRAGVPGVSAASVPSINGGRTWGVEVAADGSPATAIGVNPAPGARSPAYDVALDNVKEFRVLTNTLPAEYGNTYGGHVSVVTKSGTNEFHGSLFEYLRNSAMDATNFFSNRAGLPLGSFKRHQFGATLGGPVIRNKTFFFFYYDGLRASTAVNSVQSVATLPQRHGDFSQTFNAQGRLITMYDPTTTQINAAGTASVRSPFPGNVIPQSRFDSVAAKLVSLLPEPNAAGNAFTQANNLVTASANTSHSNKFDGRIDHRLNDAHSLFLRVSYAKNTNTTGTPLGALDNNVPRIQPNWNGVLDYTFVKSSTTVINLHYAHNRVTPINAPSGSKVPDYTALGFSQGFASAIAQTFQYMPQIAIASMTGWGPNNSAVSVGINQQFAGSLSKVIAKHTLKFGADVRTVENVYYPANAPQFSFATNYTQGPNPQLATATAGYGFASFLPGAGSGNLSKTPNLDVLGPIAAGYFQDDWKVSRKLTLNLGLRYDLFFPRTEADNQLNYFDREVVSPLAAQTGLDLHGGLVYVGQNGSSGRQVPLDCNNFSPRIGLAYSLNQATVLRGGFAIMYPTQGYGVVNSNAGFQGFDSASSWVAATNGLSPTTSLASAFATGLEPPIKAANGLLTNIGQTVRTIMRPDGAVSTYTEQWNISVQRTLARNTRLEVSYLGNRGLHLLASNFQFNTLTTQQMALGSQLTALVTNPFYGIIQSGGLSGLTTSAAQLMRPFPQFTTVNSIYEPIAQSTYHALGIHLQSRLKKAYVLSVAYTNSKNIDNSSEHWGTNAVEQDPRNLRADRSISSQDISQNFVASAIAPVPIGKGRALLSGASGITQAMLGGWQMNAILTLQTGIPIGLTCQQNTSSSQGGGMRPNSTGQSAALTGRVEDRLDRYFDTSQFVQPPYYTFGNVSRTLPDVRSPGVRNLDISVFKNFMLTERTRLQFRAEAFNLANHPLFGIPGAVFGSPTFGQITTQANSPRQLQMALRLDF